MARVPLPALAYNWISAVGSAIATAAGTTLCVLLGISFFVEESHNPYFGILLYAVLPAVWILGLLLIPLGMFLKWRRKGKGRLQAGMLWPRIDFSRPAHRNAALIFFFGSLVFGSLTAVGSYEAYHYSESVEFCGTTCHQVMEPEHTAYAASPHARVSCAECHIGGGADWFVKSKLSGAYQVWATLRNSYPRPIPTPIESLRPAQETCEQCHWPEHFFGLQWREYEHYSYDEANTPWPVTLLLKTGGGSNANHHRAEGIHWHMNIAAQVEYVARDEERLDIPWIRVTDRETGEVAVFENVDDPLAPEEVAAATPRVMDCVDCHNRPTHIYLSPDEAVDQALVGGRLDPRIPSIKKRAVELLAGEYATTDEALDAIGEGIRAHLSEEASSPSGAERPRTLDGPAGVIQEIYRRNLFPAMKVRWDTYPDHIGHFRAIGCMRCHDGLHEAEDGTTISAECDACHVIVAQGSGERRQVAASGEALEFLHPEDMGEIWRDVGCWECHEGTEP